MSAFADQGDALDWARRLMRRARAGEYVAAIALDFAQQALGLARPQKKRRQRTVAGRAPRLEFE